MMTPKGHDDPPIKSPTGRPATQTPDKHRHPTPMGIFSEDPRQIQNWIPWFRTQAPADLTKEWNPLIKIFVLSAITIFRPAPLGRTRLGHRPTVVPENYRWPPVRLPATSRCALLMSVAGVRVCVTDTPSAWLPHHPQFADSFVALGNHPEAPPNRRRAHAPQSTNLSSIIFICLISFSIDYHCHPIRVLVYRRGSSCPAFYTMKYWYGIGKDSCTTAVY